MSEPIHITKRGEDHSFGLDIFRAGAIILVVLGHGIFLLKDTAFKRFPFFRMIDGVELFFVLSGFLIGGILLKEINSKEKFGIGELGHFWKRRWFRTLPNYFLILSINYFVVRYGIIHEDISQFSWKFFLFLQNFSSGFHGFFWESWSLSIEEWFYLSAPILLIILLKYFSPKRAFFFCACVMITFPFFYRLWSLDFTADNFKWDSVYRKVVLMRLDSIGYGLLASWAFYYFQNYWDKLKYISLAAGIVLINFILNYSSPNNTFYKQVLFFSITPISAMLLLPFARSIRKASGIGAKAITHIARISYSMYLINLALISEVMRDNYPPKNTTDAVFKYLLYWSIVVCCSTILYYFFEKPVMDLRDRKLKINIFRKFRSQLSQ